MAQKGQGGGALEGGSGVGGIGGDGEDGGMWVNVEGLRGWEGDSQDVLRWIKLMVGRWIIGEPGTNVTMCEI